MNKWFECDFDVRSRRYDGSFGSDKFYERSPRYSLIITYQREFHFLGRANHSFSLLEDVDEFGEEYFCFSDFKNSLIRTQKPNSSNFSKFSENRYHLKIKYQALIQKFNQSSKFCTIQKIQQTFPAYLQKKHAHMWQRNQRTNHQIRNAKELTLENRLRECA